jgi:hypothetical protein
MEILKFYVFPGSCLVGFEAGVASGDTHAKMLENSGVGEESGWLRHCAGQFGEADGVREVISPDGSPDRFPDPRRALIGGACHFVAVPPLAQCHIKQRQAGAREPTFTVPAAPPQTLT